MHIYLVAGEDSGDKLGSGLMAALKQRRANVRFSGVGGERMQAEGLQSLFPMTELSLMGFFEVLPHLPRLMRRIQETAEDILQKKPDIVVTIDSPGFTFRLAKTLRKRNCTAKLVHYVAPSVWAWKPGRAKTTAQLFDHLLCLLPFEPPYFKKEELEATWVGHPVIHEYRHLAELRAKSGEFRSAHGIAPDAPVISFLPGSRKGELKRHLPIFIETARHLAKQHAGLVTVWPVDARFVEMLRHATASLPHAIILAGESERHHALAASDAALVKSGTVTLEVALAGTPMVVTYRVNPLSAWLLRRMIRTRFYSLINIAAEQEVLPEYMQEQCNPPALSEGLNRLLSDSRSAARQKENSMKSLKILGLESETSPSENAAKTLLK